MHRIILFAAVAAVCLASPAQAQQSNRLPFPDGSYVTDPALCRMSMSAIADRHHEMIGVMVRNIEGRRFNGGYELDCQMRSATATGNTIRIRAVCNSEGERSVLNETWVRLDERSFRTGNRTYVGCGRFIR